ncbi:MAG: DsrE family protein [Gammaproteobacteria bacterium]|nr:DsrE family protein [Gammaproteobacteria bacterium]
MKTEKRVKKGLRFFAGIAVLAMLGMASGNVAMAATIEQPCPVGLVNGLTLDEEFGTGTSQITRCLVKRKLVKTLFPILKDCADSSVPCTKPYALTAIGHSIRDYEVTHGMINGVDFSIVAVVYSSGYKLVLKGNPFEQDIVNLLNKKVSIYLCQNTARANNIKIYDLIPGVKFVTDCHTSISDFQALGYNISVP